VTARRAAAGALLLAAGSVWSAEVAGPARDLLQSSAAAYREGRLMDALRDAVEALEADPRSLPAKNYVFTIGEAVRKERQSLKLRPGEKEMAARAARAYITLRQKRTEEVLQGLRDASSRSRDLRSPAGFFTTLQGLDRSLGAGFHAESYGGQAQLYFANILDNLENALKKSSFSEAKDRLRAEGYLAYYKGDPHGAASYWEKALKADPADEQIKNDLASVREMIRREKETKEIQEYVARAEASFDAGLYADAVEAWREVYRRDPKRPGLVEKLAASRVALEKSISRKKIDALMAQAAQEYKAGQFTQAAGLWLDVLQLDPTYASARTWLRLAGDKLKEDPRAAPAAPAPVPAVVEKKKDAAPAAASEPLPAPSEAKADAEELYRRGLIAYSQGDVPGAMTWLKKSLARDPGLRRAQQALEQCQTETSLTRK
jgi:tetratricopeptide (TPR) repeat protein